MTVSFESNAKSQRSVVESYVRVVSARLAANEDDPESWAVMARQLGAAARLARKVARYQPHTPARPRFRHDGPPSASNCECNGTEDATLGCKSHASEECEGFTTGDYSRTPFVTYSFCFPCAKRNLA